AGGRGAGERAPARRRLLPGAADHRRRPGGGDVVAAPALAGASIAALAAGVRTGKWKARELVDAYLDRIERLDRAIGSYLLVDAAGARKRAEEIDAQVAAGIAM